MSIVFFRLFLVISACIFITAPVRAQQPLFQDYEHLDTESGLPQGYVTSIVQDDDGFLWVSTMEGMGRFDGKDFLRFVRNPDDTSSISSNRITNVVKSADNALWLQHVDNRVDRMDPRTFRVSPMLPSIAEGPALRFTAAFPHGTGMLYDSHGNWLINGKDSSFRLFDVVPNARFEEFARAGSTTSRHAIFRHHLGEDSVLWILTRRGLEKITSPGEEPVPVGMPGGFGDWYMVRPSMLVDANNRIVVGGPGVVHAYDPRPGTWQSITLPEFPGQTRNVISNFCKSAAGQLFFEYKGHVLRLDSSNQLSVLWKMPAPFEVSSLFVDRSNVLWVGTNPDGLYRVNLNAVPFQKYVMRKNFISDVITDQFQVPAAQVDAFKFGISKSYYLRYFQADSASIRLTLENQFDNPGILILKKGSLRRLYAIGYVDSFGSGPDGESMALESHSLIQWDANGKQQAHLTDLPQTTHQLIVEMELDGASLWMATIKEIFELRDGTVVNARTMEDGPPICTIKNDPTDRQVLWVGTLGGGLHKIDKSSLKTVATYTIEEGLPNNTINTIVPDAHGVLWISTNKGISRFDPAKQSFVNFTTADGLHETEFNRYHQMKLFDGRIAFGGSRGYTVFDPSLFVPDTLQPDVMVTRLTVNGDDRPMAAPLATIGRLELEYTENSIGLELAAMQFNSPEKNKFRYRLVGIDEDWVDNGTDRRIRYNQLPYGAYTLELNASNTAGLWSSAVRRVELVIHPPWWRTGWAYTIYGFLLFGGVGTFWNSYKIRLKAKQEAAFNLREAQRWREVDEVKTRFFSNITHEFRTPLTLILTPLEKYLDEKGLPEKVHTLLTNNYRHASKLLNLVNQLLDIAKLEAGQMPMHATQGELVPFISDIVSGFQAEADRKSILLRLDAQRTDGYFLFDKDKIGKILTNLLSNAIKFTPEGGRVACSVGVLQVPEENREKVTIRVADTGIGIDEAQRARVFERFYQADDTSTRQREGTGIGLALVRELVVLMDGNISLESEVGKGTSVTVSLPIERMSALEGEAHPMETTERQMGAGDTAAGEGKTVILVVEDNEELRSFLVENLSAVWTVLEAADGNHAWELMSSELPEVVISDIMMPGLSGIDLCKRAKSDPRTSHISFVMLTAKAAQESRIAGFEAGADEYVTKPFHLYELQLRIRNLLEKQESMRVHLRRLLQPVEPTPMESIPIQDPFLEKVLTYLERHIGETDLNVDKLAEAFAMSKSTLNRKFRVLIDQSPIDFVRRYRLRQAVRLLGGTMTVAEVAMAVGFESPSYFTQCFREQYGKTPSAFIQEKSNAS